VTTALTLTPEQIAAGEAASRENALRVQGEGYLYGGAFLLFVVVPVVAVGFGIVKLATRKKKR
jgi:hypothetical protein